MNIRPPILAAFCLALVSGGIALNWHSFGSRSATATRIDFNRDIRPILNQNCVSCHGGVKQQSNVSFIYREEALGRGKSGRPTVVPGQPGASELIARVTSMDPEVRMPYHAPPLPPQQIALLKRWIKEGAPWEEYWAFVPPKPQPLPAVKRLDWVKRPLDRFILARLEKEGLSPSPQADKAALLRRVSFDLTGLPPTPQEESAFLADSSPTAYEKQVDRLLASSRYGERWTALWLDLSRYADSKGYNEDRHHTVWPYRDWLIDAFNRNMPYDQFMIRQLAGDLLPNATLDDQIATTFQRLTPSNDEGGTDDEEFRLVAVMDRAATTWSVLNGLTINCVQCHSHPYDPIRHKEYYTSLAFFNTTRDGDFFDEAPLLRVPYDRSKSSEAFSLQKKIAALSKAITETGRAEAARDSWKNLPIAEASVNEALGLQWYLSKLERGRLEWEEDTSSFASLAAATQYELQRARKDLARARRSPLAEGAVAVRDGAMEVVGNVPPRATIEVTVHPPAGSLTALRLEVAPKDPRKAQHTPEVGFIVDQVGAWLKRPGGSQEEIAFRYFVPDSESNLQKELMTSQSAASGAGSKPSAADALAHASTFTAYTKLARTRWVIAIPVTPISLEAGSTLGVQLTQTHVMAEKPGTVPRLRLSVSGDARWTSFARDPELTQQLAELLQVTGRLAAIPTLGLPVMAEQPDYDRRETLEFERGNFLTKVGSALTPDVPAVFPKLPAGVPHNRLTWALWFFAPGQPLTARVAVNRYWEQLFGLGLVETLENFGSAGEPPSHPELLDWLALHFQNDLRWDTKALLRELLTSATYRQSARTTPQLLAKDPRNRLLARGPQQRLTAEMLRDQALLASGLLSSKMGGPPVMPPQPPGVWMNEILNQAKWVNATGEDRYRRALYTFLKRNTIYPSFLTFDAATHDVSLARRIPTNTPLQALVTLNDPVYHEAAQALAQHWLEEIKKTSAATQSDVLDAWLDDGAWRVLSRDLKPSERTILRALYEQAMSMPDERGGTASVVKVGLTEAARTGPMGANNKLRAMTAVASVFFNLDAALTR